MYALQSETVKNLKSHRKCLVVFLIRPTPGFLTAIKYWLCRHVFVLRNPNAYTPIEELEDACGCMFTARHSYEPSPRVIDTLRIDEAVDDVGQSK